MKPDFSPGVTRWRNGSLASVGGHIRLDDRSGPDHTAARRRSNEQVELNEMRSDDELTADDDDDDDANSTGDEETGLTHAERRKKQRRKRRNTRMDERVLASGRGREHSDLDGTHTTAATRLVKATLLRNLLINALLIGLWYSVSISISVYNKWMFSPGNLDFHFPLFTTSFHMVVQFVLASLSLWLFPQFRPRNGRDDDHSHVSYARLEDRAEEQEHAHEHESETNTASSATAKPPLMTRTFYFTRITPCGAATALDVGLGNFSLRFITLTFYTMCKSSVLAFALLFALIFRLEKPTWKLCAIIALMTVGVIMMVTGEAAFNALGFVLVMSASFCSGFRWSLTQILLLRNPSTSNPFSSIFFLTPPMFVVLVLFAIPIEGPLAVIVALRDLSASKGPTLCFLIMLFPGTLAFMIVSAEFALLQRSSVVTLSVCGIFKEVLTISAASMAFGDPLSPINVSGLVVTTASICAYNLLKYQKWKAETSSPLGDDSCAAGKDGDDCSADRQSLVYAARVQTNTTGRTRESLTLATDVEPGGRSAGRDQSIPNKRPEDLE